jgi:hypothetical protein
VLYGLIASPFGFILAPLLGMPLIQLVGAGVAAMIVHGSRQQDNSETLWQIRRMTLYALVGAAVGAAPFALILLL